MFFFKQLQGSWAQQFLFHAGMLNPHVPQDPPGWLYSRVSQEWDPHTLKIHKSFRAQSFQRPFLRVDLLRGAPVPSTYLQTLT